VAKQHAFEARSIRYDIRPEVLAFSVAKELAPFDHRHVDEIAVDGDPELRARLGEAIVPGTVIGHVTGEAGTQAHDASKAISPSHDARSSFFISAHHAQFGGATYRLAPRQVNHRGLNALAYLFRRALRQSLLPQL
jgi:LmbE family N-acetylglucosaminyl deacetylase